MHIRLLLIVVLSCFSAHARDSWPLYQQLEQNIWLIVAAIFFIIEVAVGGIGLFFASLGAFVTGVFLSNSLISDTLNSQVVCFFSISCLSAAILWQPLKSIRSKKSSYNSIVGQTAFVESELLNKKNLGSVKWSGTIINAMLDESSSLEEVSKNHEVTVVSVNKNIFYVVPK
jgi:membrane protein implicated in regulation of membrane protease activity